MEIVKVRAMNENVMWVFDGMTTKAAPQLSSVREVAREGEQGVQLTRLNVELHYCRK